MLGYGSNESNYYTASPLRAFENELGGGPSSSGGELLRPCGARGLSVFTSDVLPQSSTEVLEISQCIATLRFLLTICLLRCANQLAWTIELCSDLFTLLLSCLLGLSWALHSCFGHCLALPFFRLCASRRPRARLCRFVGGRRYRALRRRSASRRTRPCGFLRWTTVLLAYSWAFWPCVISVGWACLHPCPVHSLISTCIFAARSPACIPFASALLLRCSLDLLRLLRFILSVVRTISHRLGLLACRVGEASHPGPSSDSMRKDPWADFLARKHKQATPVDSNAAFKPQRTPWTQCTLDLSQLQKADDLQHLSLDSFAENAEGIALLPRQLFAQVAKVRSTKRLLVVLPGGSNEELTQLGLTDPSFLACQMFIHDPALGRSHRKLVTLVQLGCVAVLPSALEDAPVWEVPQTVELCALLSQRLFNDAPAWSAFVADSRKAVPDMIGKLHPDLLPSCVEYYGWRKIDSATHRVAFRVPVAQLDLLLQSSGTQLPFIVYQMIRTPEDAKARDSHSAVIWLGRRSYTDSMLLIKQFPTHFGLALNAQSFGLRVPPSELAKARSMVTPGKFSTPNEKVRGSMKYEVVGLPIGCKRSEIVKQFADWGWAVIPIEHSMSASQSVWIVSCDDKPPAHFYHLRGHRVLLQPFQPPARVKAPRPRQSSAPPKVRNNSVAVKPSAQAPAATSPLPAGPSNSELLTRIVALEAHATQADERHKTLEQKLDGNFAAIIAKLDSLRTSSPTSARRAAKDHTGETPDAKALRTGD